MARTKYEIQSGGVGSYSTYGFWLDAKPSQTLPTPAYDDLLVTIPHSDRQLDFSRVSGALKYPNGRDFEYTLRKVNVNSERAIVADVEALKAWLRTLTGVTLTDTWTGRTFAGCTVTSASAEYNGNLGWQATVHVQVHSINAKDVNGVL